MVHPDIVKKNFSFKKHVVEDKVIEAAKPDAKPALTSQNIKPRFQKYKSIPIKSSSVETTTTTVQENSVQEKREKQQDTSDVAVIAESSAIDPNFLIPEGTYIPCSLNY